MSASAAGPEFGLLEANPGGSPAGHLRFEDERGETYLEPFDLVETLAAVLGEHGQHAHAYDNGWIEIGDDGLFAFPQLVDFTELDGGTIRTASTVQCNHPRLFPQGLFEYQHATGETFDDSVKRGFEQWARTDLLALLDAARAEPEACMTMRMEFGGEDGAPRRARRIVFGPVASFGRAQQAAADAARDGGGAAARNADGEETDACAAGEDGQAHGFCPCCLLTNSLDAFRPLLEDQGLFALRLFASRDHQDGECQADCRVNGEDWPQGLDGLRDYAARWPSAPGQTIEFRKQYVIVQDAPE
ncbi:hypothetical protein SAMN04487939_10219 [Lysobacter sp. yr284]|uniref:DUF6348 family protein n=1 Tax=Lysobacter sp. yr284 TaxID=1761791 RepID=UPI000898A6D2|nr:DUF6348 family protein [Lysobacter sp. yr284]SDY41136.1 hypothetical protein SAMN04487939_10219 [Lysobacter sp. yr284]